MPIRPATASCGGVSRLTPSVRLSFIPFGGGRRKCTGETFALAETTIALSAIVPRWQLRAVDNRQPAPRFRTTLTPGRSVLRTVAR
ncbi:cytochrome P450 [Kitasatospora sp. NPDC056783]|uniref:cytochrome P450 n=1 Tax=Kitasatospora sp. NPDC056783 TaxID=3345943 RepID=UPI00369D9B95